MKQTFTTNREVPEFFYSGDCEMAVMIPAGFCLQVFDDFGTDDDELDPDLDDEDDPDIDAGVWVCVPCDAQVWLPSEAGSFTDGLPDDLAQLIVETPEEVLLKVRERFAEFSWMYDDPSELDEELQSRADDKLEALRDREAEVLWEIEEREGRFSQAYLRQIKLTPSGVALECVTELAEFYDDEELRGAARNHPELKYLGAYEGGVAGAVQGAIARMLIAEVIAKPDSRQVDIAAAMNIDTANIGSIAYELGKAGFFDRTKVANRVVLSPGARCEEVGLDSNSAAALIAGRSNRVDEWATAMVGIPIPDPPTRDDLYEDYEETECL